MSRPIEMPVRDSRGPRIDAGHDLRIASEETLERATATVEPKHPGSPAHGDESDSIDSALLRQTQKQIQALAGEIAELANSDVSIEEFSAGFLQRLVEALAAVGGALWLPHDQGDFSPQYQINLASTGLEEGDAKRACHQALLQRAFSSGELMSVPPQSGSSHESVVDNPTEFLLLVVPVKVDQRVEAVVEIIQRPGRGAATQRGYTRFAAQMCNLAADYFRRHRLRHFSDRDGLWKQLEQFLTQLHSGLELRPALYSIANEGRRLLECDRLSVALCQGRRCRIEVVSGLDSIDRRAQEVKRLSRLARAVVKTGEPLWYAGEATDLPPQIESALQSSIDRSHARVVGVIPLTRTQEKNQRSEVIGALVVEQLENAGDVAQLKERVELVARHAALALGNVVEHNRLFLLPVWRAIGKASWMAELRNLPKVLLVAGLLTLVAAALCLVPYDFDLAAGGTLRPAVRRDVFAGIDGMLVDVPIEDGQQVREGQIVARLRNTNLEVDMTTLLSRRTSTRQRIVAVQRSLLDGPRLSAQQQNQLNGELAELSETAESLERQLQLFREKEKLLQVGSPADGEIVTWQVRDKLLRRPVKLGQRLMTVIDPRGDWQLELEVPERRMGHLVDAENASPDALKVIFVPATHPHLQLEGRVVEVARTADVRRDAGNSVLVRVAIDKSLLPDLRDGARVTARIRCGRRPVGYVLFHDLIETVQQQVLLWL